MKKKDLEIKIWKNIVSWENRPFDLVIPNQYEGIETFMKDHNIEPEFRCAGAPWDPIYKMLIDHVKPKIILEVGSYIGYSAIRMADYCKENNIEDFSVVCIDPWLDAGWYPDHIQRLHGYPTVYFKFLNNVKSHNHQDVIMPLPMPAITAYKYLTKSDVKADLIYIDGSHEHDDVYLDFTRYYQLLNKGGVIYGDDWSWSGVQSGVEEGCKDLNISGPKIIGGCWVVEKI